MAISLCIRVLALRNIPVSESLIVRGLSCLVCVLVYAHRCGLPLFPKSLKTQLFRAGLAGLALTFLSLSYNWLSASAVSVLSNIDVPLMVVLGPLIGVHASRLARWLSGISISFLILYVSNLEMNSQIVLGLSTLLVGTLLLCVGYVFIKRSMADENRAVAVLTPAIAIIVYGVLETTPPHAISTHWSGIQFLICVLSGGAMFVAYIATMKLYELTDLASAEFPTLIASVAIQPIEAVLLNESMKSVYLTSSVGFLLTTYVILKLQDSKEAHA